MNTRNHRNLCKGIEKVAGFTSSGQGGERFLCDWSNGRFADGNVGLTNLDKFPMWLIWQQICGFANGNVGLTNLDKLPLWLIWQQICGFADGNVGLTSLDKLKNVEKLVFRWDPDKISLQDLFCAGYMLCEMVVREQETQVFTFRDDSWLQHDWRILKLGLWEVDTFSDSRNCEYHRRVGFWVQAPEGDWARGWQKYGEESCDIKIQKILSKARIWMNCLYRQAFSTSASRSIWDRLMFFMRQGFRA